MPKISELSPILGRDTESRDLFVTVNLKSGSTGTKNITRAELIQSIQKEAFDNLTITGGNISNVSIGSYSGFTGDLADNDIFLIKDISTGNTFALSFSKLQQEISDSFKSETRVYVSAETEGVGNGSLLTPFKYIEDAVDYINTSANNQFCSINVMPGQYYTDGEMEIPDNCAVIGLDGPHSVEFILNEGFEERNCLLIGSGCQIQNITFKNQRVDSFDDPTKGFAIAFRPNTLINKSPYVLDCIQMSNDDLEIVDGPLDPDTANQYVGRGGGLVLADRSIIDQNSIFNSIVVHSSYARSFNGMGLVAKNGAEIQGSSVTTMFQRNGYFAKTGGKIILENCNTQYGDISFRTNGSTNVVIPETTSANTFIDNTFADLLNFWRSDMIDDVWNYTLNNSYLIDGYPFKRDIGDMITSIIYDFRTGSQIGTRNWIGTVFDYDGNLFDINTPTLLTVYDMAFDRVKWYINNDLSPTVQQSAMLAGLIDDVVKGTIASPTKKAFSSRIESVGHSFLCAGAGINKNALTINNRRLGVATSVKGTIMREGSTFVRFTGTDELGNQFFSDGLKLNSVNNKLEGKALSSSLKKYTRRASNNRISL